MQSNIIRKDFDQPVHASIKKCFLKVFYERIHMPFEF